MNDREFLEKLLKHLKDNIAEGIDARANADSKKWQWWWSGELSSYCEIEEMVKQHLEKDGK